MVVRAARAAKAGKGCQGCQRCRDGKRLVVPAFCGARVDDALWQELADAAGKGKLPRENPRLLARFAFGYSSPQIASLKLKDHALYGRFVGCAFKDIYDLCVALCS